MEKSFPRVCLCVQMIGGMANNSFIALYPGRKQQQQQS